MPRWTQTVLYCSRLGELASKRPEPRQNTTHDDFCKNVTEIVALFENATARTCPPWGKKVIRNDQKWHFFAFFITFFPHGGQVGAVALSNQAAISVTFRQKSWWVVFCLC